MEPLTKKTYIANGCCVSHADECNAVVVIYLPKDKSGKWIGYTSDDPTKSAPSVSYRYFF